MKKIGILGGTFDPPHNGHLLIAHEVYRALHLDEVWFMPVSIPPHKERKITGDGDRLAMLELALIDHDHFIVQPIELERDGPSYTYDTMKILTETYDVEFYFIIGGDMVEYLPKWYKIDELLELVTFVGVGRTGYSNKSNYPIIELETPRFDVSSTMLRERFKHNGNTRLLLPDRVKTYIEENQLYE